MRTIFRGLIFSITLFSTFSLFAETPRINLPPRLRQDNWVGNRGQGSCVHASMISLFNWQHQYSLAKYWKSNYENGETWNGLTSKLEQNHVKWAGTYDNNDVKFLEWAIRTRRGCMVTQDNASHMVVLVHLDKNWAGILDNNDTGRTRWIPRDRFLDTWYQSNSWALTPMYSPPPPKLHRRQP